MGASTPGRLAALPDCGLRIQIGSSPRAKLRAPRASASNTRGQSGQDENCVSCFAHVAAASWMDLLSRKAKFDRAQPAGPKALETPMRLYDYGPSQNCFKMRLLAAHLGLSLEVVPVSIFQGEGALPGFLAKNPMGTVPLLE